METSLFMAGQLLDMWRNKVEETSAVFESLGASRAMQPVAPGKNRVIYLLGHLLAIHDGLFVTLEVGERQYAHYDELFLMPQHTANVYPPYAQLLAEWVSLNERLLSQLERLAPNDWQSRHHHISAADFLLQPGKTKFCAMLCATTHLYHHAGQLALIVT